METTDKDISLPSYKEIFQEAGSQIKNRSGGLLLHSAYVFGPLVILGTLLGFVANYILQRPDITDGTKLLFFWGLAAIVALAVSFVRFYLDFEKTIWIDSHFDGKPLTSEESNTITKKLFYPLLKLYWHIALRYYVPLLLFSTVVYASIFLFTSSGLRNLNENVFIVLIFVACGIAAIPLGAMVVMPYKKFRYIQFLFLDTYNGDQSISYAELFAEMNRLNSFSNTDAFKKSVYSSIGIATVGGIADTFAKWLTVGYGEVYSREAIQQATRFGTIAAKYLIYQRARESIHGNRQLTNAYIYSLVNR